MKIITLFCLTTLIVPSLLISMDDLYNLPPYQPTAPTLQHPLPTTGNLLQLEDYPGETIIVIPEKLPSENQMISSNSESKTKNVTKKWVKKPCWSYPCYKGREDYRCLVTKNGAWISGIMGAVKLLCCTMHMFNRYTESTGEACYLTWAPVGSDACGDTGLVCCSICTWGTTAATAVGLGTMACAWSPCCTGEDGQDCHCCLTYQEEVTLAESIELEETNK